MTKIVFDARMYGLSHAGIGRYIKNLLSELVPLIKDRHLILIVNQEELAEIKNDLGTRVEYELADAPHYSLAEQIEIPKILKRIKPDLVHFPHFNAPVLNPYPFVVTIHDLIKHYFHGKKTTTKSAWLYWPKYLAYRLQVSYSLKYSKQVLVPSKFWKDKLVSDFNLDPKKIRVTYEAIDPLFSKKTKTNNSQKVLEKYNLKKPFLVYTGSVYPHKNLHNVLLAIKKIPNLKLAVVCSRDLFVERLENIAKKLNVNQQVNFLGFVPDTELIALYKQAVGLIQPSLMEGFGLTGLEAMAGKCPVLSSNASCLPEVYGEAAIYFDPIDPNDIAKKISKLLNNPKQAKDLRQKGSNQVKIYDWKDTAKQTWHAYQQVLSKQ